MVLADTSEGEIATVAAFLTKALAEGISASDIDIFVRSAEQLPRARAAALSTGLGIRSLVDAQVIEGSALVGTMHLAKGLEFKAVVVMACDENVLPLAEHVADVADELELDEVVATERELLYVALTRARDRLLVSGIAPGLEFLEAIG